MRNCQILSVCPVCPDPQHCIYQCCGSVTFLYGSGSADPYHLHKAQDPDSDPAFFLSVADKIFTKKSFCLLRFEGNLYQFSYNRNKVKKRVTKQ